MHEETQESTVN